MSFVVWLAKNLYAPKARAFEKAAQDPIKAQEKTLLEYLQRNKNTEYGKKYGFASIKSIADFQKKVPLTNSTEMRPYFDRIMRGERNVLTSDPVIFFGTTSGTTSKPKYIPVTQFSRKKKAELMDIWAYYIMRDHPNILDGKVLALISPDTEGVTESGIPYGAESGHAYKNLPAFVKRMYAVPYEAFTIEDYAARYYSVLRLGIGDNISTLATLNPTAIVLLCQRIAEWQYMIIEDIEKGTINKVFNIPSEIRKKLLKGVRPDPRRASELREILREKKTLIPKDFWKNLTLIECWKGGTVKLYLKELPQYFGDTPVRDFGCLSTEARTSVPTSDEGAGGVLALETNFYEFIAVDEIDKPDKRFLLCNELEQGKKYYIVVTTPGGLYRYNIDDIIIVDGFVGQKTPVIEFVQKGGNAVSLTGEKVYEAQVNAAVLKAVETTGTLIKFFSATIEPATPGHYVFLVEFDKDPEQNLKRSLLTEIEKNLRVENREYNDLRNEGVLADPAMKIVRKGAFEKYRMARIASGAHDGQFKAPELTGDIEFQKNFEIVEEVR